MIISYGLYLVVLGLVGWLSQTGPERNVSWSPGSLLTINPVLVLLAQGWLLFVLLNWKQHTTLEASIRWSEVAIWLTPLVLCWWLLHVGQRRVPESLLQVERELIDPEAFSDE